MRINKILIFYNNNKTKLLDMFKFIIYYTLQNYTQFEVNPIQYMYNSFDYVGIQVKNVYIQYKENY